MATKSELKPEAEKVCELVKEFYECYSVEKIAAYIHTAQMAALPTINPESVQYFSALQLFLFELHVAQEKLEI